MRVPRFHCPQRYRLGDVVQLEADLSHYALKVLRLKLGDEVVLFNGQGREFNGQLCQVGKGQAAVKITSAGFDSKKESTLQLHLVYGLARFEKTDWVIQKSTELGVHKITPVVTRFSEVRLTKASAVSRLERWCSIAESACEQSGRTSLPEIEKPISFVDWIEEQAYPLKRCAYPKVYEPSESKFKRDIRLLLYPASRTPLSEIAPPPSGKQVVMIVGPEGGLSPVELLMAEKYGFESVRLGPRILRTETAAISAVAVVQCLWGDLSAKA